MQGVDFYQNHLNRVSRSFAYCIARLENPFRTWVSLSYLLCRALDTIEDAPWLSRHEQRICFESFRQFLRTEPSAAEIEKFVASFPARLPEGEAILLGDLGKLLQDFHSMPARLRNPLGEAILSMSRGMQYFQGRRLRTLAEVNQYCFFVAGLVGELLNNLLVEAYPQITLTPALTLKAHHFGLFLQKVNLLKDQREDEGEGRFLIHSRSEVLASLRRDAEQAFAYLRSLPKEARGYRLFCAISLFLGLDALPWFQRGWLAGVLGRIPRAFSEKLFAQLEHVIDSELALTKLFEEKLSALSLPVTSAAAPVGGVAVPAWFRELYSVSELPAGHLAELGMI